MKILIFFLFLGGKLIQDNSSSKKKEEDENSSRKLAESKSSDKFAPKFDGLRFIETLVTAHR